MPGIGDLVVNLSANTDKLRKGLGDAKGGLSKFASSAVGMINPVKAAFAAMTAAVVSGGLAIYGLTERLGTLAGVADRAQQTGLSGKFLQQIEFAADQSGVSAEALTKSIAKLTIAIGQAASGSKSAADGFKSLGLDIRTLSQMSPQQQFEAVGEAISKLPTASARAAAAVKIFGKSGMEAANLFANGMGDVTELMREAERLGIGLSDEDLAKAGAADDAIQKMKASFSALIDQVAVGLAPTFETIATAITNWIPPLTEFVNKFNALPEKAQWSADAISAAMDVAFESIKANWEAMLADMLTKATNWWDKVKNFGSEDTPELRMRQMGEFVAEALGMSDEQLDLEKLAKGNQSGGGGDGLTAAQDRLAGLMGQLDQVRPFQWQGPKLPQQAPAIPDDGSKLRALFSDIVEGIAPIADGIEAKFAGVMAAGEAQLGGWMGTFSNWFKDFESPEKQVETKFAGAMEKGSAEAYSTLVRAMVGGKDPVVAATKEQTKELVKAIKASGAKVNVMQEFKA